MKGYLLGVRRQRNLMLALLLIIGLSSTAGHSQGNPCVPPPPGIVAWWQAENDATDAVGVHPGSLVNGADFVSGVVGQAFRFDGVDDHVRIPHDPALNPTGSFSIEMWIFPTDDRFSNIYSKWGDAGAWTNQRAYVFSKVPGRGLEFAISDDAHQGDSGFHKYQVPGVLTLNSWNHVAGVYDQPTGTRIVYVNAIEVGRRTDPPILITDSIADVGLGVGLLSSSAFRDPFAGRMDEVTFYNRAISAAEINAIYQADSAGKCRPGGGGEPCPSAPPDVVSWWPGEDDALDIVDSNHGVPINGTAFVPGLVGHAFSFDGFDDHVNIPHSNSIFFGDSEPFTLEAWFRPESNSASYFILKNAGYGVRWQGGANALLFYNGNNHLGTKTSWQLGRWYHVALVDDGVNSVKLYIDGVLDKSDDGVLRNPNRFSCLTSSFCFPLQFGAWFEPGACGGGGVCNEFFQGQVDEVTLYRRVLTAAQIQAIFLLGSRGKCDEVDSDGDGFSPPDDCDDLDPAVFPGAVELYDARDNDCDGLVDEGLDDDGDGVPNFYDACNDTPRGVGVDPGGCPLCAIDPDNDGDGFPVSADCNDTDNAVHPGATETCNNVDDDCNGLVDEGFDADGDGYTACAVPVGDCNDADPAINPAALELPGNAIDENCDGSLGACDPEAAWRNHGEFVRCVTAECEQLVAAGVLTDAQCDVLVGQAGRSDVGK